MLPPHAQTSLHESVNIGKLEILAFPPGDHGVTNIGIQGMGVKVPIAAAVAAATRGLLNDLHIPKEVILSIGTKSMIFPICMFPIVGRNGSIIIRLAGAAPKEHCKVALLHTGLAILSKLNYNYLFF